jgi:hypothetical protein
MKDGGDILVLGKALEVEFSPVSRKTFRPACNCARCLTSLRR